MSDLKIKIGTTVKMNKYFLQTLYGNDRRNEARKRYVVENIQKWNDGTVIVDLVYGRNNSKKITTSAGLLDVA